jgi:sortase (surface protein transpeptidase)
MTKPTNHIAHQNYRIWIALILFVLLLSGCAGDEESKQVLQINIRSNRVDAQTSSRNVYAVYNSAPETRIPPTPTVQSTPTPVQATSTPVLATVAAVVAPTPTPLLVPLGRPERIVIPSVGVDTKVNPVYSQENQVGDRWFQHWDTTAYAAGFHEGSALLGQMGNTVLSGHNNIDGAVFRNLYQVQPGAVISLYAAGFRYDYVVEDQFIVREAGATVEQRLQNATWISTTIDERLTLVSCWPPDGNDYRVIVVAKPRR